MYSENSVVFLQPHFLHERLEHDRAHLVLHIDPFRIAVVENDESAVGSAPAIDEPVRLLADLGRIVRRKRRLNIDRGEKGDPPAYRRPSSSIP